jgi:hypothetical protein
MRQGGGRPEFCMGLRDGAEVGCKGLAQSGGRVKEPGVRGETGGPEFPLKGKRLPGSRSEEGGEGVQD